MRGDRSERAAQLFWRPRRLAWVSKARARRKCAFHSRNDHARAFFSRLASFHHTVWETQGCTHCVVSRNTHPHEIGDRRCVGVICFTAAGAAARNLYLLLYLFV